MKLEHKVICITILVFAVFILFAFYVTITFAAVGDFISVPTAPGSGSLLVSTTTGRYVASTTPTIVGFNATSTYVRFSALNTSGAVRCAQLDAAGFLQAASAGCGTGSGGDPNVILKLVGGTTYFAASTTANSWFFDQGYVSAASSSVIGTFKVTDHVAASSTLHVTGLSRFFGAINASSTASTTAQNGFNISTGCFAVADVCLAAGGVTSVTAGNSSLTISPNTGAVLAQLNVGNANDWSAAQTFSNGIILNNTTGAELLNFRSDGQEQGIVFANGSGASEYFKILNDTGNKSFRLFSTDANANLILVDGSNGANVNIVQIPNLLSVNASTTAVFFPNAGFISSASSTIIGSFKNVGTTTATAGFKTATGTVETQNFRVTGTATSTIQGGVGINTGGLRVGTLTSCNTIDTDADGNLFCGTDGGGSGSIPNDYITKWATSTTDTTAIQPSAAAKVGIGTSSPAATFAVQGGAFVSGTTTSGGLSATSTFSLQGIAFNTLDGSGLASTGGSLQVGAGTCITVNANDVAVTSNCTDATTLDSVDSGSFLRSDTDDQYTSGTLTLNSGTSFISNASSTFTNGLLVSVLPFQASSTALFGPVATFENGLVSRASSTFANGLIVATLPLQSSSTLLVGGLGTFENGLISRASSTVDNNFTVAASSSFRNKVNISKLLHLGGSFNATSTATSTIDGGLAVETDGFRIGTIPSCTGAGTLETDSAGNIFCGTDDNSGNTSGWTDDGTLVRLTAQTDNVGIGTTSADVTSVTTIAATSTTATNLTLKTLAGQLGDALRVQDNASTTLFSLNTSGGFLARASSSVVGTFQISDILQASSTLLARNVVVYNSFISNASSTFTGGLLVSGLPLQSSSTLLAQNIRGASSTLAGINLTGRFYTDSIINSSSTATSTFRMGIELPSINLSQADGNITLNNQVASSTVVLTSGGATPLIRKPAIGPSLVASSTADNQFYVLDFQANEDTCAMWQMTMPDSWNGGSLQARFYWTATGTPSGSVVWGIRQLSYGDGESQDAALSATSSVTDAFSTGTTTHVTAFTPSYTPNGSPSGGEAQSILVCRDARNASDSLTSSARLMQIILEYGKRSFSD